MDLPWLRQGGPPHVGDQGGEGVHRVGHLQPGRCGLGGGGGVAGGFVVPHPAPPVQPHGVGPAGGRLSLEEGEAAERAEVLAGGGVVPALQPAVPGRGHSATLVSFCHMGARYQRHV